MIFLTSKFIAVIHVSLSFDFHNPFTRDFCLLLLHFLIFLNIFKTSVISLNFFNSWLLILKQKFPLKAKASLASHIVKKKIDNFFQLLKHCCQL